LPERVVNLALIAVIDDLFFAVKIRDTAQQAGVAVEIVGAARWQAAIQKHVAGSTIEGVILDLNSPAALDVIGVLKREARTQSVPTLGFVSHVAADVIAAARAAGCDQVLARSAFTKQLPELLRNLSQAAGIREPGSGERQIDSRSETASEPPGDDVAPIPYPQSRPLIRGVK